MSAIYFHRLTREDIARMSKAGCIGAAGVLAGRHVVLTGKDGYIDPGQLP
ncbi:hypothetical protein [Paenibacillus nasutitermitis]|uniref:Uncharacterized protein n=1 Tax=Paenibacillus nasutitermitis TaxID=1652958 RepID=A0A916ZD57_9BACL|nr:hypothetical protein [Paenibacillus nasutitermitis]GGD89356.1 hypothetical protein GCM10010911_54960 [Paenibacillus nasutitermitis]